MDNTIILQGSFLSTGASKTIQLRSDVDWMEVYNYSQAGTTQNPGRGCQFYWQRGMSQDTGLSYSKTNSANSLNLTALTSGGFTYVDTSLDPVAARLSLTGVSADATPLVTLTATTGLVSGDVVRFSDVSGAYQLGGVDFTIGSLIANTSFTLPYMSQLGGAGTGGYIRKIKYEPLFYPRRRYISAITQASQAVVTLTVTHQFTVGQQVRFIVPDAYGMIQMNNLTGEISAINTSTNTVTVNIDSSAFTTFAFPASGGAFTPAQLVPVGEGTDTTIANPNLLDDATVNLGYIGMILAGGASSPAGSNGDTIYWKAGKSFSNSTT